MVFQEAIFSQTHLLNDEHINFIINLCKKLTSSYNVSIHINLLHQFDNNKCPFWIDGKVGIEKNPVKLLVFLCRIQGPNSLETIFSWFPKEIFRTLLNDTRTPFLLIHLVFENQLSCFNKIILDFLNKDIPETSVKYQDFIKFF